MAGAERAPSIFSPTESYFEARTEREPERRYEAAMSYDQRRNNEQVDRLAGAEGRTEAMAPSIRITPSSFVPERSKLTIGNLAGTAIMLAFSVFMIGFALYSIGMMALGAASMGAFVGKLVGWFGFEIFTMVNPLIFKMLALDAIQVVLTTGFALYFIGLSMARISDSLSNLYTES